MMRTLDKKLSFAQCEAIRQRWLAGESQKGIAESLGVCPSHVSRIARGDVRKRLVALPPRDEVLAKDKGRQAAWRKANVDHVRVMGKLTQHAMRDGGKVTAAQWEAICEVFDHRCAYCGVRDKLMIEHVIPLSRGGRHEESNVVPACGSCNYVKANDGPLVMVNRQYFLRCA